MLKITFMSLLAIFLASLTGSLHCAGMCGGFVAFYSGHSPLSILPHALYNLARALVYVSLGTLAGLLGSQLNLSTQAYGIDSIAAWLMGFLLCLWGLSMLLAKPLKFEEKLKNSLASSLYSQFQKFLNSRLGKSAYIRAAAVGLLSVLLPCGWLYAFVAVAAAAGSAADGALIMFVFWLGTLPVMGFLGGSLGYLGLNLNKKLPVVTACLIIAAGVFAMLGKANVLPSSDHAHHQHLHIEQHSH